MILQHPFPEDTRVRITKHSHIPQHIGKCGRVKFSGMGYAVKIDGDPMLAICSEDEVEEENPIMTILKCGFDKTRFDGAQTWQKILDRCKLTYRGELPDMKGFEWRCDNRLLVVTGDNPITGMCRNPALNENPRNIVKGWAGYIGVEGEAQQVLEFVGLVFMEAGNVKAFNAREHAYI